MLGQSVEDQLVDDADLVVVLVVLGFLRHGDGLVDHLVASNDVIDDRVDADHHRVTHDVGSVVVDGEFRPLATRIFAHARADFG